MAYRRHFSPAEWEVLQFVTETQPVAAREVAAHFAQQHAWARTTVLTMMQRLCEKGYLVRTKIDGVYHYAPGEQKGDVLQRLVREFVQKALGGRVAPFVTFLSHEAQLSDEELAQLKKLVQELDGEEGSQDDHN